MNLTYRDKLKFFNASLKKNSGPLLIGLLFILLGAIVAYIGYAVAENNWLTGFGLTFISFSGFFLLYTMPSSFMYYYEQELTKKYGRYTSARVINKRIHDYSHTSMTFENGQAKHFEEYLYVIEFQFSYDNQTYTNECFFEEKSTFEAISINSELPIQYLRHDPSKVKLRRRKLANDIGIPEKMCQ